MKECVYLESIFLTYEQTRFPQITIIELGLSLCPQIKNISTHNTYKGKLFALVLYELISDSVCIDQFLKIDFEPLTEEE